MYQHLRFQYADAKYHAFLDNEFKQDIDQVGFPDPLDKHYGEKWHNYLIWPAESGATRCPALSDS